LAIGLIAKPPSRLDGVPYERLEPQFRKQIRGQIAQCSELITLFDNDTPWTASGNNQSPGGEACTVKRSNFAVESVSLVVMAASGVGTATPHRITAAEAVTKFGLHSQKAERCYRRAQYPMPGSIYLRDEPHRARTCRIHDRQECMRPQCSHV